MNLFPTDILVLAVVTQLVTASPQTHVSYEDISEHLAIPLHMETIARSINRLETNAHLRRVGGLTRKGYLYELSTTVRLAIAIHE